MGKRMNKEYFANLRKASAQLYAETSPLNWGEMIEGKYVMSNRYDFKWRFASGQTKSLTPLPMSLKNYVENFKAQCEMGGRSVSVSVGTDSQNHLAYTRFVTAICLQVERNGIHVIVSRMDIPKIYDYRYRLLKETDISAEFARNYKEFFKSIGMPLEIHGDYNSMTNHKSNGVVTEASNYLKTHGFNLVIKNQGINGSFAASYAADHFC